MKILTVCEGGNVRSVTLAYILKVHHGLKDVIAVGIHSTTPKTFEMMANWADTIIVVGQNEGLKDKVPKKFNDKLVWFDIGHDVWGQPLHHELMGILKKELNKHIDYKF